MSDAPLFGKIKNRNVIDDKGSTMTQAINYMEGNVMYPIRRDYEFRHRLEKYIEIKSAIINHKATQPPKKYGAMLRKLDVHIGGTFFFK
jgi:hypothetical protein